MADPKGTIIADSSTSTTHAEHTTSVRALDTRQTYDELLKAKEVLDGLLVDLADDDTTSTLNLKEFKKLLDSRQYSPSDCREKAKSGHEHSIQRAINKLREHSKQWRSDLPGNYKRNQLQNLHHVAAEIAQRYLTGLANQQEILRAFQAEQEAYENYLAAQRPAEPLKSAEKYFENAMFKDNTKYDSTKSFAENMTGKHSRVISAHGGELKYENGKMTSRSAQILANAIAARGVAVIIGDSTSNPGVVAETCRILIEELGFPPEKITISGEMQLNPFGLQNRFPISSFWNSGAIEQYKLITQSIPGATETVPNADPEKAKIEKYAKGFLRIQNKAEERRSLQTPEHYLGKLHPRVAGAFNFLTLKEGRVLGAATEARKTLLKSLSLREVLDVAKKVAETCKDQDGFNTKEFYENFTKNFVNAQSQEAFRGAIPELQEQAQEGIAANS